MNNYGIFGGIILLVIFIFVIAMELRKYSGKKTAMTFLQELGDEILNIILDTINSASPEKFPTLYDFNTYLINEIYDNVWDFVSKKAESDSTIDSITKAVFKYIDSDILEQFINDIISKNNIDEKIANSFAAYSIENSESIVEEDKKLEEEYSDDDQYIETSSDDDLAPAENKEPSNEELASLNPEREDEEEFNVEDDSMEIITDKKEIITARSKTGQDLYYEVDANGKKKRVSKEYALQHMEKKVQ